MTLENFLQKEIKKIDEDAEHSKNLVRYFVDFVDSHYDVLSEVFSYQISTFLKNNPLAKNEDSKKELADEKLYSLSINMIKELNHIGSSGYYHTIFGEANIKTPDIKLGYAEYEIKDQLSNRKKLTSEGLNLVNNYRKIIGKDLLTI